MLDGRDAGEIVVDCQNVWKVFGVNAPAAMRAISETGISKSQVLQEYNCVVGVAGVNLQVRSGEIFCVMGLSGSGKSTLVRLVNLLIEPTEGRVLVKNKDIISLSAAELRELRSRDIGMVFQSVALLPHRTVLENAAFGLEARGMGREERNRLAGISLEQVGLSEWMNRYPRELSGGMQQRVGIARALAADPEIILMDEPFSALDPMIRRQLQDEFRLLIKSLGKSAIFITHDLDEAIRIGDRIAIMKDGGVAQVGTAEQIVTKPIDSYVTSFVAGISKLQLVKARSVMESVEKYGLSRPSARIQSLLSTRPDADLGELVELAVQSNEKNAVNDIAVIEDGNLIGIVTVRSLLQGIAGRRNVEVEPQ